MKDSFPNWRNASYSRDAQYTETDHCPLLTKLIQLHENKFWDGTYFYTIEGGKYIKRWPDWRNKLRIPMEKHKARDLNQKQLSQWNHKKDEK